MVQVVQTEDSEQSKTRKYNASRWYLCTAERRKSFAVDPDTLIETLRSMTIHALFLALN